MLDVVGVLAINCCGRTSMALKFSCPAMGDNEKNCCCITGSTDAATELVESATLRSTLTAIQSLQRHSNLEKKISDRVHNALTLRTVSKFGMHQKLDHYGSSMMRPLAHHAADWKTTSTYQVSHDLTGNITPADENAPRTHCAPLLTTMICTTASHQPFTAFVGPRHDFPHRLIALGKTFHQSHELDLQQLDQVFMAAVAYQGGLVSHGFKIYFLP